ncbi:TolC family protein [Kineosporia babensis]|uniref:TolC family protein n=1 Tax=Kineosporia babensis TaxID=499548 RepID=A0A9X1SW84_9ACTN|nr:TolC family protein [Kineosporia babensis]MCD5314486.1 TolC family protein [Kineosporia babensis]
MRRTWVLLTIAAATGALFGGVLVVFFDEPAWKALYYAGYFTVTSALSIWLGPKIARSQKLNQQALDRARQQRETDARARQAEADEYYRARRRAQEHSGGSASGR